MGIQGRVREREAETYIDSDLLGHPLSLVGEGRGVAVATALSTSHLPHLKLLPRQPPQQRREERGERERTRIIGHIQIDIHTHTLYGKALCVAYELYMCTFVPLQVSCPSQALPSPQQSSG